MIGKRLVSTLAAGAALAGALLLGAAPAAASDGNRWPGTREEFLFWDDGELMRQIGLAG